MSVATDGGAAQHGAAGPGRPRRGGEAAAAADACGAVQDCDVGDDAAGGRDARVCAGGVSF